LTCNKAFFVSEVISLLILRMGIGAFPADE